MQLLEILTQRKEIPWMLNEQYNPDWPKFIDLSFCWSKKVLKMFDEKLSAAEIKMPTFMSFRIKKSRQ